MHVFLYEFITGGGLVEAGGDLPRSLLQEAKAMVAALADDLGKLPQCRVTTLRDARIVDLPVSGSQVIEVQSSADERELVEQLSAAADATIVIAPEFDALLSIRAEWVEQANGQLLSPPTDFIALTADKQRTIDALDRRGVPTPFGRPLDLDESLPVDFPYPAVLKPRWGAGSQDTHLVARHTDEPPPYAWPRRLERYYAGLAASVALLCGPAGAYPLIACRQHISTDGQMTYLGGALPLPTSLAQRAARLALAVADALPAARGYIGVDMILGGDPDGGEDVVVEVNPRLTTSYVGLRALAEHNLAQAMIDVAQGRSPQLAFRDARLEFSADGTVWRVEAS